MPSDSAELKTPKRLTTNTSLKINVHSMKTTLKSSIKILNGKRYFGVIARFYSKEKNGSKD